MERKQLLLLRDKLLQSRREGEPHVPNFLKKTYEILEVNLPFLFCWQISNRKKNIKT